MTLEAILAYLHLLAILTMVVFVASEAALCRVEWLNAAVVERLGRVDMIYGIAAVVVLATGVARTLVLTRPIDTFLMSCFVLPCLKMWISPRSLPM